MHMAPALVTSLAGESKSTIVLTVIIAAVVASLGYRLSQRIRETRGVTPWRIPSIVWAVICFLFAPFGIALELIAIMSTRPNAGKLATPKVADARIGASYGGPANATEQAVPAYRPRTSPAGFAPPHSDVIGKPALFGWYPDAAGRHELRYWDGRDWTGHVSDSGRLAEDPLGTRPLEPEGLFDDEALLGEARDGEGRFGEDPFATEGRRGSEEPPGAEEPTGNEDED